MFEKNGLSSHLKRSVLHMTRTMQWSLHFNCQWPVSKTFNESCENFSIIVDSTQDAKVNTHHSLFSSEIHMSISWIAHS